MTLIKLNKDSLSRIKGGSAGCACGCSCSGNETSDTIRANMSKSLNATALANFGTVEPDTTKF